MVTVDTKTDEQVYRKFPRGSYGPHSIEPDNDGHMGYDVRLRADGKVRHP